MSVKNITNDNFDEFVDTDKTVLIDFYADWCNPCKMMSPLVDEISEEFSQFSIGKVNVDEQQELAAKFTISSIPTLLFFKNGEEKFKSVGLQSKQHIIELLKSIDEKNI